MDRLEAEVAAWGVYGKLRDTATLTSEEFKMMAAELKEIAAALTNLADKEDTILCADELLGMVEQYGEDYVFTENQYEILSRFLYWL